MNDLDSLLSSDFGLKPQGKSAPMSASKSNSRSSSTSINFDLGSSTSNFDPDAVLGSRGAQKKPLGREDFGDLFGGSPKSKDNSIDFDSIFSQGLKSSSSVPVYDKPVYDKPVYDDDIFQGLPGVKSFGSSLSSKNYGDEFESVPISVSSPPSRKAGGSSAFDDLLGGFGKAESQSKNRSSTKEEDRSVPDFDDLIPGFGGSNPSGERSAHKPSWSSEPVSTTRKTTDDPFAGLGSVPLRAAPGSSVPSDPLQEFSNLGRSGSRKADGPSVSSGMVYEDLDPFEGLAKSVPSSSSETNRHWKDKSPFRTDRGSSGSPTYNSEEHVDKTSPTAGFHSHKPISTDNIDIESHKTFFDRPSASNSFTEPVGTAPYQNIYSSEANAPVDVCEEKVVSSDDVWLTVSEIPLLTQPTTAPPPARPPPPRPAHASKVGKSSFGSKQPNKSESYGSSTFEIPKSSPETRSNKINEFEDYPPMGRGGRYNFDAQANGVSSEEMGFNSDAAASAAAMKEAMDRAEAKFRHAKGVRERESTRAARTRESVQLEKDSRLDAEERALKEKQEQFQREREDEESHRRIEKEREREEKEREQRRLDRERERAREEREWSRQAVERATREARERAAAEARTKAERAAVDKVNAEARGRAERTAVMRVQAEARERAAADAKERAERAAEARDRDARMREKESAEAREKEAREKSAEARRRAERAAVERAAAEARERAAAEARERAAAAAKANQRKNNNDLESFFSMGRASSAPRPRANSAEASFDAQFPNNKGPEVARTSDTTASNIRKASSSANIVDDLSSIFGGGPTSGEFQNVEGETEERRRARLERHQRTQERAAKALAEKNQRDLDAQRDQAERHRFSESLDAEIRRWAAGKEGNLRALLSTLQYVLWPECGWQPVSLTDLITAAAVKKVYRKATLCIHPDKVQQKGANLQQKYIAEKVFDLLKEAWNKLNSEELF